MQADSGTNEEIIPRGECMSSILLKNCLLIDLESSETVKKDILIVEEKIEDISSSINYEEEGLRVIDIEENYALPGLIDCHTHLGIIEEATGKIGVDNNETSDPITPNLRAIDAINPMDIAFGDALSTGVTAVMSTPGSNNVAGGLCAAIKTSGKIIDKMILRQPVGFKVALGENPMGTYGKNDKCPVTRMGIAGLLRELFMESQDYLTEKEAGKITVRDIRLEAVIPLLKGEIPLRAHAHRSDDIVTAIRIAEEFNIKKLVIEHGTEANIVKEYLKEKNISVAYGPMLTPRIKMELRRRHYSGALELVEAGINVALITDHPYNSIDQLRTVSILAVSEGLKPIDALKCLTRNPAEILGCEKRIGRLDRGYDADIAIFDGNPLNIDSKVIMTLVNGNVVYKREKGTSVR